MRHTLQFTVVVPVFAFALLTPGCSSTTDSHANATDAGPESEAPSDSGIEYRYSIRGRVAGLAGTGLTVHSSSGDDLQIAKNGEFVFPTRMLRGADYEVTVAAQPKTPSQTCTATDAKGTIGNHDVGDIVVNCVTEKFSVGGNVRGLTGTGLVLKNQSADDTPVTASGAFTFASKLAPGESYFVTVYIQPTNQTCAVTQGSGTIAGASVNTVLVTCTP